MDIHLISEARYQNLLAIIAHNIKASVLIGLLLAFINGVLFISLNCSHATSLRSGRFHIHGTPINLLFKKEQVSVTTVLIQIPICRP
mgnify:CR=1 FL=1